MIKCLIISLVCHNGRMEGYFFYFRKGKTIYKVAFYTLTSKTNIGIFQNLISLLNFPLFCLLLTLKPLVNFLGLKI